MIVEHLLTCNPESSDPIPAVDDDGDSMWEDCVQANKMVVVINAGLKMGVGKIASQVTDHYICYVWHKITKCLWL